MGGATDEDPDFIAASLRAIYYEVSVAKQHTLAMTFLGKLGMLPRIAPFNTAIALITDPHATFLADLGTWWTWKRRPIPGTTPIPIQKALGPVSFGWDIRHTLPMTGAARPTPALEAPEEHHLIVTGYPADRYRCARAIATRVKAQCKLPRGINVRTPSSNDGTRRAGTSSPSSRTTTSRHRRSSTPWCVAARGSPSPTEVPRPRTRSLDRTSPRKPTPS